MPQHEHTKRRQNSPYTGKPRHSQTCQQSARNQGEPATNSYGAQHTEAHQQAAAHKRAHDVGHRHHAHHQTVLRFRQTQHFDKHKRRSSQKRKQPTIRGSGQQGVSPKRRVPNNSAPSAQQGSGLQRQRVAGIDRFLKFKISQYQHCTTKR